MINKVLSSLPNTLLKAGVQGTRVRHNAISDNIANLETPGYKRKVVRFEQALAEALERGQDPESRADRVRNTEPEVSLDEDTVLRIDQGNVDIDREMADLAMNTGKMVAMLEILNREFRQIKLAMKDSTGA